MLYYSNTGIKKIKGSKLIENIDKQNRYTLLSAKSFLGTLIGILSGCSSTVELSHGKREVGGSNPPTAIP